MAKVCAKCGRSLSFLRGLGAGLCQACQAQADREQAEAARAAADERTRQEQQAAAARYAAARRGEASAADLDRLAADGYLVAGGRLVACPVCGHDRFDQQQCS